jgi:hypothetical protein
MPNHKPDVDKLTDRFGGERGMLTDTDRRFLWGTKTYPSKVTRSERRRAIRGRVEYTLLDLIHLTMLEDDQRERVFEALGEYDPGALRSSVASLIEFLYLGLDGDTAWLNETVAHGIHNAEKRLQDDDTTYYQVQNPFMVNVSIEIDRGYNVDEIENRFRAGGGDTLTPTEVGILVKAGRIEPDEVAELENKRREFSAETAERDGE